MDYQVHTAKIDKGKTTYVSDYKSHAVILM